MTFIERIIKPFTPPLCIICRYEGNILCDPCKYTEFSYSPSVCAVCNKASKDFSTCRQCFLRSRIRHIWFVAEYEGVVKDAIRTYKYAPMRDAAVVLAEMMRERIVFADYDIITYIPSLPTHIRKRGFDHAKLLAYEISKKEYITVKSLFVRNSTRGAQVGSSRRQRFAQMQNAFRLRVHAREVSDKRILIVDDVISTGATLSSAAHVLKDVGAKEVSVVVFARNTG